MIVNYAQLENRAHTVFNEMQRVFALARMSSLLTIIVADETGRKPKIIRCGWGGEPIVVDGIPSGANFYGPMKAAELLGYGSTTGVTLTPCTDEGLYQGGIREDHLISTVSALSQGTDLMFATLMLLKMRALATLRTVTFLYPSKSEMNQGVGQYQVLFKTKPAIKEGGYEFVVSTPDSTSGVWVRHLVREDLTPSIIWGISSKKHAMLTTSLAETIANTNEEKPPVIDGLVRIRNRDQLLGIQFLSG